MDAAFAGPPLLAPRNAARRPASFAPTRLCAPAPPAPPAPLAPPAAASVTPSAPPARLSLAAGAYPVPRGLSGACSDAVRDCPTIPALFRRLAVDHPHIVALIDEHRAPPDRTRLTYFELDGRIRAGAAALARLGLRRGDVIAVFAENSHRWLIADQAAMSQGAAPAVRGVEAPVSELRFIYDHSGARALVVENAAVLDKLLDAGMPPNSVLFAVVLFGDPPARPTSFRCLSFADFLREGHNPTPAEGVLRGSRPDTAAILYTSGTTGHPKGVVLSHGNLLSQVQNLSIGSIDPVPGDTFVTILPCWHIFERTSAYFCMSKAMTVVYSNKRRFREDLVTHRPHVLISVPRVFENLHSAIMTKLKAASALRKAIFSFFSAVSVAYVCARRRMAGLSLKHMRSERQPLFELLARAASAVRVLLLAPLYALANLLVWKKIRAATGGRVQVCVCGGGSLAGYLEDFFESAGIEICVGYGLTETAPVICNRFHEHNVRGSAGFPLPGTLVRIVDVETGKDLPQGAQGVLHAQGPQVFAKYLNNPEATEKAFDEDGFFDTGDLAYIAPSGDVVITGRSKDVIVLSNGENVEPAPIEDAILGSPLIDQVVLVGQDERALGALVVPRLDEMRESGVIDGALHARAHELLEAPGEHGAAIDAMEREIGLHPHVYSALSKEIAARNEARESYSKNERIAQFRVVLRPFTVENGMMTQTLKIRKQVVADRFSEHIQTMYRR